MERSYRSALRRMSSSAVVTLQSPAAERSLVLQQMIASTDPACMVLLKENLSVLESEAPLATEQISEGASTQLFAKKGFDLLEKEFLEKMEDAHRRWTERFLFSELEASLRKGGWLEEVEGRWQLKIDGSRRQAKGLYAQMMQQLSGDVEKNLVVVLSRSQYLQERIAKNWYSETVRCSQTRLLPTLELSLRPGEAELLRKMRDSVGKLAMQHFQAGLRKTQRQSWLSAEALCRGVGVPVWNPLRLWESGWRGFLEDYLHLGRGVGLEILQWYRSKWDLYLRGYSQGQFDLFRATGAP